MICSSSQHTHTHTHTHTHLFKFHVLVFGFGLTDPGFANLSFVFAHLYCLHTLMDFMTPPMFDTFNIIVWKAKMSMYLKTLGLHVFLTATKKSYLGDSKHIEANA